MRMVLLCDQIMRWLKWCFALLILLSLTFMCTVAAGKDQCYNVTLPHTNSTEFLSSSTYPLLASEGYWFSPGYLYYCWDIRAPEGMQMRALCRFQRSNDVVFYLYIFSDGVSVNHHLNPLVLLGYRDKFYSPGDNLQLIVYGSNLDGVVMTCNFEVIPDNTRVVCGAPNVIISGALPFTISIPDFHSFDCVWLLSSPTDTFIYVDLLDISLENAQSLSFWDVNDINGSKPAMVANYTTADTNLGGLTLFFGGSNILVMFSCPFYINGQRPLEMSIRSEANRGQCGYGQLRCDPDNKCLRNSSVCNGAADCSNYVDESTCEMCGAAKHDLQFNEPITIIGGFFTSPDGVYTVYFASYLGTSESIPNTTISSIEHPNSYRQIECIWKITEPPGARIRVEVVEFAGFGVKLAVGNGEAPSLVATNAVLKPDSFISTEVLSVSSNVWMTLQFDKMLFDYLGKLRIVLSVYNVTECDTNKFTCPTGQQCLEPSSVCNGIRECAAYGDELGCGRCDNNSYACTSGDCIPKYLQCNNNYDCTDFSDELLCGHCEHEQIRVTNSTSFSLEQNNGGATCLWFITSDPGSRVQLALTEVPLCDITIGEGVLDDAIIIKKLTSSRWLHGTYPRYYSSSGNAAWVLRDNCAATVPDNTPDYIDVMTTRIDISQYVVKECEEDEFSCNSGSKCLPEFAVCDGWADCPEREDEYGCGECTLDKFSCRTGGGCLFKRFICNSRDECLDLSDEFDCGGVCGESQLTISQPTPFTFRLVDYLLFDCRWYLTSPVGTFIYIDVENVRLRPGQELSFGTFQRNGSYIVASEGVTLAPLQQNGTTYYFSGNTVWIGASCSYRGVYTNSPLLELSMRSNTITGQCSFDQFRCEPDSKCLSNISICDGAVDCSDYADENKCQVCGIPNHDLGFDQALTIFGRYRSELNGTFTAFIAIYHGTSEAIPESPISKVEHPNIIKGIECLWQFTEPPGSRIRVGVEALSGWGVTLTVGNGNDPSSGAKNAVLLADMFSFVPTEVLSVGEGVWITLEFVDINSGWLDKLRLVLTVYNVTECVVDEFACPTGQQCLNSSSVCDNQRECVTYGDELGCGTCDGDMYSCASGDCIPKHQHCNKRKDCDDFSDELFCGFCEDEHIEVAADLKYSFIQTDPGHLCIWIIRTDPSYRLQLKLLILPYCVITVGEGPLEGGHTLREIVTSRGYQLGYPRYISSTLPSMWIVKDGCLAPVSPNNTYTNTFEFNVIRYKESECQQGQFSCPSGPECIPQAGLCDGWSDCPEKEDEFGCDVSCGDDYFSCRGIGCAARSSLCDGLYACDDGSDEFDCGQCINGRVDVSKLDSVFITSPLWPNRYPERTQCQHIVVAEVGYHVVVTFLDFDIDQGHDLLFINNNRNLDTDSLIASGGQYPITVASDLNELSILFRSNNIVQKGGFKLQVEQTNEVTCEEGEVYCVVLDLQLCVQNNTSERGLPLCFSSARCGEAYILMTEINYDYELKSPNYPLSYPAGVGCWWLVYAKNRVTPIRIEIIEFLTETVRDVLLFEPFGGTSQSFALHGNSKVRSLVFNNMDSLYISFVGDSTVEYKGFHLEISNVIDQDEHVCRDESLIDCDDGSCVLEGAICNGFIDCQGSGLDENQCVNVSCPGFYHCENSTVCQYQFAVCDGRPDCHLGDDEENCDKRCPSVCKCWYDVMDNLKVICEDGWNKTTIENIVPISEALTLSGGNFTTLEVGMFKGFTHLNALSLANNGITHLMPGTFADLHNLTFLDISENLIQTLEPDFFSGLSSLETMIAMDVPLRLIGSLAFHGLGSLKTLVLIRDQPNDIPVYVDGGALTDLVSLEKLYVDDYRLCCEFVKSLTNFKESSCETTELQPPLNLCGSLMQNTLLRVSMWVLGLSALIGNAVVIIQRIKESCDRKSHNHPSRVSRSIMVLGLAVSDLTMGVYMLIIAGADVYYGEGYSQIAKQWRSTAVCQIAGVLSVMSSEASVFIVTLISVDCFISIVYPFSRWRLRRKSTIFMVLLLWSIALGLSIGPTVFIRGSDSDIYGLSDVCIGLPLITKPTDFLLKEGAIDNPLGSQTVSIPIGTGQKPAWIFSIILFLGVNLVCFLVVFICYIAIFVRVKRTADKVRVAAHREREIKMAIKMAVIVGTDFACWMPVIVMGILSQTGTVVIGPDMYAWIVVFILPINSSLNPYLYTLYTSITEQRTKSQKISASKRTMNVKCLDTLNSDLSESKSNHDKPVPSIHM